MIDLDAATVMIQWATGGLAFLWVTTRTRTVGLGYGWLQRMTFMTFGIIALAIAFYTEWVPVRDIFTVLMILASGVALWVSYVCLLYTSPSPRDATLSRMPSSA